MLIVCLAAGSAQAADEGKASAAVFPTFSVRALQTAAKPGGLVTVELLVANVSDLGVYQFGVGATGGDRGKLSVKEIVIGTDRKDYVFAGAEVIPAVNLAGARAGALRRGTGQDVGKSVYIATVVFEASPDAQGTFEANIKAGVDTFMRDSRGVEIVSKVGAPAKITISDRVAPKRVDKKQTRE